MRYHGLTFNGEGRCTHVPGTKRAPVTVESGAIPRYRDTDWSGSGWEIRRTPTQMRSFLCSTGKRRGGAE